VLVLALDTATARITAGVVELGPDGPPVTLAGRDAVGARAHAELLAPAVRDALAEAGHTRRDLDAVVVGLGPGPFTGLRVGLVTAVAMGDALGLPVHGVPTHDAVAAGLPGRTLVVTDARRREVYWAAYSGGVRLTGPHVEAPAALVARIPELGAVASAGACAAGTGLRVVAPEAPGPAGLVACAVDALRAGVRPGPLEPLYLRRPDAVAPGPRKPVGTG
jgi:tRNA threonylcarbamoyl adenosine modification protein YeaZ